jgi:hypothetical protein
MTEELKQPETTETAPDKGGVGGADIRTFTQDEVNALMGERARRASESAIADLLKSMGFEKPDDLKAVIAEAQARKEADMTEADKAKAEAEKARKETDALKAALEAERAARLADKRDAAIRAALKQADDPAAVLTLLQANFAADVAEAIDAEGAISDKAVSKLVTEAAKKWPGMFKSNAPGSPSNAGGRIPQPDVSKALANLPKLRL